jgi:hypothetical protein
MGLTALAPAGVAMMARGVVHDGKADRLEALPELAVNRHRHLAHHSPLLPDKTEDHILP